MKKTKRYLRIITCLTLALAVFALAACGNGDETTTQSEETQDMTGEYVIDITDFGMPLQFYLKIDDDDTFQLSPGRTYETDKGHGTIGSSGDVHMFVYSDSTAESPKTTTFSFEEGNLVFDTSLYYGSSTLAATKVDEDNPDITYQLVANTLLYDEYHGEYAGEHSVTAMGSTIDYVYSLSLTEGRTFHFVSTYQMGGDTYTYTEEGHYDIEDDTLTLYPEGEENIQGSFDASMNLTVPIKPSDMADRESQTLRIATTADCAGTYYGYATKEMGGTKMYDTSITLYLDKFGGYEYTAEDTVNGTYTETGSFTHEGAAIVFTPADQSESREGTLNHFILDAPMVVSSESTTPADVTLYCELVQGIFAAEGEDDQENTYQATLSLHHDGTYDFTMVEGTSQTLIDESGTFTVTQTMFTQLVLTASDQTSRSAVVSAVGFNMNIDLDEETTVGFILTKE